MPNLNHTIRPESGSLSTAVASLGVGGVPLSRRALAVIVAVTILASSAGCTSWRTYQGAVTEVVPPRRSIRVWLPDASRLTLDDARVAGDTLYGRVIEHLFTSEPLSIGSTATVAVGELFPTVQIRNSAALTVHLMLVGVVGIALLVYAANEIDYPTVTLSVIDNRIPPGTVVHRP